MPQEQKHFRGISSGSKHARVSTEGRGEPGRRETEKMIPPLKFPQHLEEVRQIHIPQHHKASNTARSSNRDAQRRPVGR